MSMKIEDFLSFVKSEFVGKKGWQVVFDQPSYDGYGYECTVTVKTPGHQHDIFCQVDDDKTSMLSGQSVALERGNVTDKSTELPSGSLDGLTLARIISAIAALETSSKPARAAPASIRTKTKVVEKIAIIEKIAYHEYLPGGKKPRRRPRASEKSSYVESLCQFTLMPFLDESLPAGVAA